MKGKTLDILEITAESLLKSSGRFCRVFTIKFKKGFLQDIICQVFILTGVIQAVKGSCVN